MRKGRVFGIILSFTLVLLLSYLVLWPVAIEPRAWQAPRDHGYVGVYTPNQRLQAIQVLPLPVSEGPEALAVDPQGRVVTGLLNGDIVRREHDGDFTVLATTGGRPLGLAYDAQGGLWIADAYQGLVYFDSNQGIQVKVTEVDGRAVRYANDVAIAADGTIYFSDSSSRFPADRYGTYGASLLDIMEHAGNGRVLAYEPASGHTYTVVSGIHFANGVALSSDQQWLLVNETASYRVLRVGIGSNNSGQFEPLLENLPGFPDNLTTGRDGKFWLGLVSPRSALLDQFADAPFMRKVVQRLPAAMRPKAQRYSHLLAIDIDGNVLHSLQDPEGRFGYVTGAVEVDQQLFLSSLHEAAIGQLEFPQAQH